MISFKDLRPILMEDSPSKWSQLSKIDYKVVREFIEFMSDEDRVEDFIHNKTWSCSDECYSLVDELTYYVRMGGRGNISPDSLEHLKLFKNRFPELRPDGPTLYRGVIITKTAPAGQIIQKIIDTSSPIKEDEFVSADGNIVSAKLYPKCYYKPIFEMESWSNDIGVAVSFATPSDKWSFSCLFELPAKHKNFVFNGEFMNTIRHVSHMGGVPSEYESLMIDKNIDVIKCPMWLLTE